jgi:hypothetical protein
MSKEKPLQSRFTLLPSKFFPAKFLFQNTKENFGGKEFTLQKNEVLCQNVEKDTKILYNMKFLKNLVRFKQLLYEKIRKILG